MGRSVLQRRLILAIRVWSVGMLVGAGCVQRVSSSDSFRKSGVESDEGKLTENQGQMADSDVVVGEAARSRGPLGGRPVSVDEVTELVNQGNGARNAGRRGEAEACYRAALVKDPLNKMANYSLGEFLVSEGRRDEALVAYRELLTPRPDRRSSLEECSYVLCLYGDLCLEFGEPIEARRVFRKALDVGPVTHSEIHPRVSRDAQTATEVRARAYVCAAIEAANQGHEVSIRWLRKAIALSPNLAVARFYLAYHLNWTQRFTEMRQELAIARSLAPNDQRLQAGADWLARTSPPYR